jgi:hypothetical protein
MKFLLSSMKSLTHCVNHSSNPLQRACSGFLIAACVSTVKVIPKPACDPENSSESWLFRYWKKSTNESKEKPEQKFDAAFGTILKL